VTAGFDGELDLGFLDQSATARSALQRKRARLTLSIPVAVSVTWLVYVTASGQWPRVGDHVGAAITMVFGSFVAGSTPQGGGAVAFPVFTKLLEVPSSVARSFSLSIQAIGMGTAALVIIVSRRAVAWRAVAIGAPVAVVTFIAALLLAGDSGEVFWPSRLPGAYVKVTFTLVLAGMAWLVFLGSRVAVRKVDFVLPAGNSRVTAGIVVGAALGGLTSALVGSGADVFIYLFVVVLFGIDPRVGVPTSVIVMAVVSVTGFVLLGVVDGQLSTSVVDGVVVSVGGVAVDALAVRQADMFGMWLAALPVVAWGAPLGSWAASKLRSRQLVVLVIALGVLEVLSTVIFVDELRSDVGLAIYAAVGLAVVVGGLSWLARHRQQLFGLPAFSSHATLRRPDVDVANKYSERLGD